jgi:hypothetical protein
MAHPTVIARCVHCGVEWQFIGKTIPYICCDCEKEGHSGPSCIGCTKCQKEYEELQSKLRDERRGMTKDGWILT